MTRGSGRSPFAPDVLPDGRRRYSHRAVVARRTLLVGVVAAFMEAGPYNFHEAVDEVAPYLPKRVMPEAVPENWGLDLVRNGITV